MKKEPTYMQQHQRGLKIQRDAHKSAHLQHVRIATHTTQPVPHVREKHWSNILTNQLITPCLRNTPLLAAHPLETAHPQWQGGAPRLPIAVSRPTLTTPA